MSFAEASERDVTVARALTRRWAAERYGAPPDEASSPWRPERGVMIRWERFGTPDGPEQLFELVWTRPHASDPSLWVRTRVDVGVDHDEAWLLVREQFESTVPVLTDARLEPRERPDLVARVTEAVRASDGGWRVRPAPLAIGTDRVPELDAFVRGGRTLPVLVLAPGRTGSPNADAARLSRELVGLAHVAVLTDVAAAEAFAAELGVERGVPEGGTRLYWPAWRSSDSPGRHPRWRAEDLADARGPRVAFARALVDLVDGMAVLRVADPPLGARLRDQTRRAERAARREELTRLRANARDDRAMTDELLSAIDQQLHETHDRVASLEAQLTEERDLRRRYEDAYVLLAASEAPPAAAGPRLVDVLREAAARAQHLVVLSSALDAAARWRFDRTDRVAAALAALDRIGGDWAEGRLTTSFTDACRAEGLDWAAGVSDTAIQKYTPDYLREYDGRTVVLGPHLRLAGPGGQVLRVYCCLDGPTRRIVVGHVGEHLRDRSTGH